jgi:two-component system KDP operon response regulator KdpE
MLTAKARDADILTGFDAGADDYLTKPFNAKELLARVKAVLRRSHHPEEAIAATYVCGELEIDYARHLVTRGGETVSLTRTEYALLRELALNANRVMSHPDLLATVWGPEYRDEVDYLRAYVRYLRRKIEADPSNPRYIVTLPGVGYMLSCPDSE